MNAADATGANAGASAGASGPGAMALVGSGEYLPAMLEVERELLDDAVRRGRPPRYVQLATAAGREGAARLAYWRDLGAAQGERLGVETHFLPVFDRRGADDAAHAAAVDGAALVYLSGGDPRYLADALRGTQVGDAIERHWRTGGALAGCSAGAMVMGTNVPSFRLQRGAPVRGLDLVPGLHVVPHFRASFAWMFKGAPAGELAVGIEEHTALVRVGGDREWRVAGAGSVHLLSASPHRVVRSGASLRL